MSNAVKKYSRTLLLCLLIAVLVLNTLVLAPKVAAASDANKTETDLSLTEDLPTADSDVFTHRAITMDEAKREAQFAVNETLAMIAAGDDDDAQDVPPTEKAEVKTPEPTVAPTEAPTEAPTTAPTESATSSSTKDDDKNSSTVVTSTSGMFLMDIAEPDPNFVGYAISLSDYDRDLAERMVMGEAGSMDYVGIALVAQCIRDTYVYGGYSNIADVLYENGYYGSTSITPSQTVRDVVSYIFDEGGSAVQHRINVFYATNYCSSPWHEAQHYICSSGYVRFFDMYS